MFLICISGRFFLLNTLGTKIHFIKIVHVHDIIFTSQHFDWILCIISECDWMNYFYSLDITIVKKNFEYVLGNSKTSDQMFS